MATLPEYDLARKRTTQRLEADDQVANDAITRRAAQMGGVNKGSFDKMQMQSQDQAVKRREEALQGIDVAEAGETQRRQEILDNRGFISGESQKGRDFQSAETQKGRDFTERFQGGQFDRELEFKKQASKDQLQLARDQFSMDQEDAAFNRGQINDQKHSRAMFGAIDPGGALGGGNVGDAMGGSYFCTEMQKLGIISKAEYKSVQRLYRPSIFTRPDMLAFYIKNAPKILKASRENNFDWTIMKDILVSMVIGALDSQDLKLAQNIYIEGIKQMCLTFPETKHLWDDSLLEAGIISKAFSFCKLLKNRLVRNLIFKKTIGAQNGY